MPVAVLLASLVSLGNLARHNELLALKVARVSTLRIVAPLLLLSLLASVLGLTLRAEERGPAVSSSPFIELLVRVRDELRGARQFPLADVIRNRLRDLGVDLEDTPQGTQWRRRAS